MKKKQNFNDKDVKLMIRLSYIDKILENINIHNLTNNVDYPQNNKFIHQDFDKWFAIIATGKDVLQ